MSAARIFHQRQESLRSRCERRIADIPVPQPFDLAEFARAFSRRRGRELIIRRMPGSPGNVGRSGM